MEHIRPVIRIIPPHVTIVAVTKTFSFLCVKEAYEVGIRHIGENRLEEAEKKIEKAREAGLTDIVWHMVGHVQGRKAKKVAWLFHRVDSVDSISIARKLGQAARVLGKRLHILLEVNLSGESTKYGFDLVGWKSDGGKLNNFLISVSTIKTYQNIIIDGLMTMPPYVKDARNNRLIFRSMKQLSETIRAQIPALGAQLSMGTSCDYAVAIEEEATEVRLGEALFGKRNPKLQIQNPK